MFKIGAEQLSSIRDDRQVGFRDSLVQMVLFDAPAFAAMNDKSNVEAFVDAALEEAHEIGFEKSETRRFFVQLSVICGLGLRDDPQFAFLALPRKILYRDPLKLADAIHGRLSRYMSAVLGPDSALAADALQKGLESDWTDSPSSDPGLIATQLAKLWPQKPPFIGMPMLVHAMDDEMRTSDPSDLPPMRRALIAALFGTGWRRNPLCSWLLTDLEDQTARLRSFLDALRSEVRAT